MAEKYRREHHQNHRKNTNTHSTNAKNEKEGVHRNAELDSMRPGDGSWRMENISAFDKYRYYYGGGKKKDEDDEDEDEMASSSEYETD